MSTRTMGLFEAKTHLSELIAQAERGDEVIITRHNKPVAKIVPVTQQPGFDPERRRKAIEGLQAIGREIANNHGAWTSDEIVEWVREGREERDAQVWEAVSRKP